MGWVIHTWRGKKSKRERVGYRPRLSVYERLWVYLPTTTKLGIVLVVVGIAIMVFGYLIFHGYLSLGNVVIGRFMLSTFVEELLGDLYANAAIECLSIAVTVLVVDYFFRLREEDREKRDLILQMGSSDNVLALEAVRKLRARGWIDDGSLRNAKLWEANLENAKLTNADLMGANLEAANLKGAELVGANFYEANLEEADLSKAILGLAFLGYTNLQKSNLTKARMEHAILEEAYLWEADLKGASLAGASLRNANLWKADLRGALLDGFDPYALKGKGIKVREADLYGANLMEANLAGAKITNEQLASAETLKGAIMPDGTNYDGRFDKEA